MSVLPKDYKEPVLSNYLRFEQGDNTFRILSEVIVGMEYWKTGTDEDGKPRRFPVRKRPGEDIIMSELEVDPKTGNLDMPKHFWAALVWNRDAEKVQILSFTQSTIRKPLIALERNKKWGDLREYDVVVTREGEGKGGTSYTVTPNPKEKIDPGIVKMAEDMKINLDLLYKGEDPFAESGEEIDNAVEKAAKVLK